MHKSLSTIMIFGIFCLFFGTGCASKTYFEERAIRSIGLSHNLEGLENVGSVMSKDCSWFLLNGLIGGAPTFESALEAAIEEKEESLFAAIPKSTGDQQIVKPKVRLLQSVQIWDESWNSFVIGKKCLRITAIVYR